MPRHPVEGTTIRLCRCTRIAVTCRKCGPLHASLDIRGRITLNNLKNYQAFVLRIHNEAFHKSDEAVPVGVRDGNYESTNGGSYRERHS